MIRLLLALFLAAFALASPARADDNRPLAVTVTEEAGETFRVTWKIPANVEERLLLALAADCTAKGGQRRWSDALGHWAEATWTCPGGIAGKRIAIDYPLANPNLATIARFHPLEGPVQTVLAQPQDSGFAFAVAGEEQAVFPEFLVLGVEHILTGFDHLLFIAGLIFITRTPRRVLATITGFTLAHSVTLALAALDIVRLPISAIEGVIALSIVFLAVELAKGPRDSLTWNKPFVVASAFGLLHGFGFAAVLKELGLPEDGLVLALLAFNIGIELGQLLFAGVVLGLLWLLRRYGKAMPDWPAQRIAGYTVGILASYWMIGRLIGG